MGMAIGSGWFSLTRLVVNSMSQTRNRLGSSQEKAKIVRRHFKGKVPIPTWLRSWPPTQANPHVGRAITGVLTANLSPGGWCGAGIGSVSAVDHSQHGDRSIDRDQVITAERQHRNFIADVVSKRVQFQCG